MSYSPYFGGAAGAALGYIHGNTKGALAGYKLGSALGKS